MCWWQRLLPAHERKKQGRHLRSVAACAETSARVLSAAWAAQVVWSVLIDAVPTHGRNAQQITGVVQKQIKTYAKLLNEFTTTAKQEAALLVHVQARSTHRIFLSVGGSLITAAPVIAPPAPSESLRCWRPAWQSGPSVTLKDPGSAAWVPSHSVHLHGSGSFVEGAKPDIREPTSGNAALSGCPSADAGARAALRRCTATRTASC